MRKKTALVTGASGAIGGAAAIRLAKADYAVAVHYNSNRESAAAVVNLINNSGGKAIALCADLTDFAAAVNMLDDIRIVLGDVDVLVNNAGISDIRPFASVTPEVWNKIIDVNLTGAYNCCRAVLPMMLRLGGGSIVNVSSVWGIYGASCEVPYSASKAGLIGLTQALAKELGPSNIRVNCVAPGVIDTQMNASLGEANLRELCEQTPLCRIGKPEEVAEAIYFLADKSSSFITGAILPVTGGFC